MKKWLIDYSFCLLVTLLIFYASVLKVPGDISSRITIPYFDKIVHFAMYFVLSATICFSLLKKKQACSWKAFGSRLIHTAQWPTIFPLVATPRFWWIAGVMPALYGGLIEIVQECYFPPRTGDWFDFSADATGVFAAMGLFFYVNTKFGKHE